jgi:hypothetical protein
VAQARGIKYLLCGVLMFSRTFCSLGSMNPVNKNIHLEIHWSLSYKTTSSCC